MMNIEIYLNNEKIQLGEENGFRWNYNLADVSDISGRKTSFSKPFTIPGGKENNRVFKNLNLLDVKSPYQISKKAPCLVKIDGVEFLKGWARIDEIRIKDDSANRASYYTIVISEEINRFYNNLKGKNLKDLDLSDFDHIFNLTNVTNSWNTYIKYKGLDTPVRDGFGYDYPLVDFGGKWSKPNNNDWYLTGFRPWIFAKTIIDYIFKDEGATYEGFFDSSYFGKLLISPNKDGLVLNSNEIIGRKFEVGLETASYSYSGTYSTNPINGRTLDYLNPPKAIGTSGAPLDGFSTEFLLKYNEFATFSSVVKHNGVNFNDPVLKKRIPFKIKSLQNGTNYIDYSNQFDSNTFSYKSINHSVENIQITIPSMMRVHIPSPYNFNALPGSSPKPSDGFTGDGNFLTGDGVGILQLGSGVVNGIYRTWCQRASGALELLDTRVENYMWEPDNGALAKYTPKSIDDGYWIYEYLPPTPVPDDTVEFVLNPGDEIYVEFSYLMNMDNDNAKWVFNNCYASIIHLSTGLDSFKNEPSDVYFLEGVDVKVGRLLPDVSRLDFLSSIFSMFNLYMVEDKKKPNHWIIETRDKFFNFNNGLNWTYKLDRTAFDKKPIPLQNKGEWTLSYKVDKDFFNETYDNEAGKTWGEYNLKLDNGLEGESKLNLIFSPSPLLLDSTSNRRVSRIFTWDGSTKKEVKNNPRILFKKFVQHSLYNLDDFKIIWSSGTYSSTNHSTATHLDNPYNPRFDLNFYYNTSPGFYYVSHNLINNNLYNQFWKRTLDDIVDPNNFMLVGFFNLSFKDVYEFDFRRPIFIDNGWFYVNRIIDWNPDRELTKVELIKIKRFDPKDFLSKEIIERGDKGEENLGELLEPVGPVKGDSDVRNPDNGLIVGEGNSIGKVLTPGVLVGSGNIIKEETSSTIVVGDRNSVGRVKDGLIIGENLEISGVERSVVSGRDIRAFNIKDSEIVGSSMSVSGLEGSSVYGRDIEIGAKMIGSFVLGDGIKIGTETVLGDFSTINVGASSSYDSVIVVGKDLTLNEGIYESGVITDNYYLPSGGLIKDDLNGGVSIVSGNLTYSFGPTLSYFPGGREISRRDYIIGPTSSTQSISVLDGDYFLNIEFVGDYSGPISIGDIYLPLASDFPNRELIIKVTSGTYSMPGTFFNLTVNNVPPLNYIDRVQNFRLYPDKNESITLISDGIDNWSPSGRWRRDKKKGFCVLQGFATQTIATPSIPQLITFDTGFGDQGITTDGLALFIEEPALYKMDVTLLIENQSGQPEDLTFWLNFNGSPYPNSAHYTTIPAKKSTTQPSELVLNYSFIGESFNPNDYVELYWMGTSTDLSIRAKYSGTSSIPDAAAFSVNLHKISSPN